MIVPRTADEARALGRALRAFAVEDAQAFRFLFDPDGGRTWVQAPRAELSAPLKRHDLVHGDERLWGTARIRQLGGRVYLLGLGVAGEYEQDLWPETDAMLAVLEGVAPGRLLDVGTGCGVVAIEAAARGFAVVATDLYDSTVALARLNAQLNDVDGIDFRTGHLFEPVAGERFDLVLTAPHYGRTSDQLRVEVLRAAPEHLTVDGRLLLATQLEWEDDGPLGIESVLRPLVARGLSATVRPISLDRHRHWFRYARAVEPVPRLVSRHRFTVELRARPGELTVEAPDPGDQPSEPVIPLARLRRPAAPMRAAVVTPEDVARLRALLAALDVPTVVFDGPLPTGLVDACRFESRPCVGRGGVAAALVDLDGQIRPCTHGGAVATVEDTKAMLDERLRLLAEATAARRGCASCLALGVCSQCLFPGPLPEAEYCELVRAEVRRLPVLHRLLETVKELGAPSGPVRVARWPRRQWSPQQGRAATPQQARLDALADRWNELATWSVEAGETHRLFWLRDGELFSAEVDAHAAALGERIADGLEAEGLADFARERAVSLRQVERALDRLATMLA
jgi:SAM-dependent methyltransferase